MTRTVRVCVFSCPPNQPDLEFRIIFDDGYEKYYKLDSYAIAYFRGSSEFDIIQHFALEYYEMICEPVDSLKIILF
jgi:hypothetical protein